MRASQPSAAHRLDGRLELAELEERLDHEEVDAAPVEQTRLLDEDESVVNVLSFGYPAIPRDPESRPAMEWIGRAKRKPREDVVKFV